jgi:uncharacterized protein (DUF2147 family)
MRISFLVTYLLLFFNATLFAQNQICGKWLSEDKEGITEIYKYNNKFYGKLIWLKEPYNDEGMPYTDIENPDKTLRARSLHNLVILKDFFYKNSEWKGGTIYDPESGKTYTCTLWLTDKNTLKVRGYWGIFYQTQTWTKTK